MNTLDIQNGIAHVTAQFNAVNVTLFVLLMLNMFMAENPNIKANTMYSAGKALLAAAIDQVWPQKPAAVEAPAPTTPTAQ